MELENTMQTSDKNILEGHGKHILIVIIYVIIVIINVCVSNN